MLSSYFGSLTFASLAPLGLLAAFLAIGLLVMAYVFGPLRTGGDRGSRAKAAAVAERAANLAVLRERRREIETLYAGRPEDDPQRRQALEELTLQAASELGIGAEREALVRAAQTPEPQTAGQEESRAATGAEPATSPPAGRLSVSLMAGALLLGALVLYLGVGAPDIVSPEIQAMRSAPPTLDEMADRLRERLAQEPDRADGWQLLGRTELSRGRFPEAIEALERARALTPQDAGVWVDLADALAQNQGARLEGRPIELIREALKLDPRHPKGLALAGAWAVSQQDFPAALVYWANLLELLPPGSAQAQQVEGFMADLRAGRMPGSPEAPPASEAPPGSASPRASPAPGASAGATPAAVPGGGSPGATPGTSSRVQSSATNAGTRNPAGSERSVASGPVQAAGASPAAGGLPGSAIGSAAGLAGTPVGASLSGTVDLAPGLVERVRPGDTLFIVARKLDESGRPSGPPVAVLTARAGELPLRFTLDDSMAMIETARLSSARQVAVVARISRSGEATVRSGDLQGSSRAVSPGVSGIQVIINTVVP